MLSVVDGNGILLPAINLLPLPCPCLPGFALVVHSLPIRPNGSQNPEFCSMVCWDTTSYRGKLTARTRLKEFATMKPAAVRDVDRSGMLKDLQKKQKKA